jgi:hypothetical protein
MSTDTLLGAVRPLVVRHRGDTSKLVHALVQVYQRAVISTHPEREPGQVFHDINARLKELYGPAAERDDFKNSEAAGRILDRIAQMNLPDEHLWAIIDRVLGEPLSPHERDLLEGLRS